MAAPSPVAVTNDGFLHFSCPHCQGVVYLSPSEVNCAIFRHAVLIATGEGISPHAPKAECDALVAQGAVRGCAGPFKLSANRKFAEVCSYDE